MPLCASLGSTSPGHGCFRMPTHKAVSASSNVFADGKPVHRQGDRWCTHICIHRRHRHGWHSSVLARGSHSVYVNGRQCGRIGDRVACGSRVATSLIHSVFVGG